MKNYTEDISKFPISEKLSEITATLKNSPTRFLILTAETAAGKSTVLPLALLEDFQGKIVMTEPRRLAVLGVANRVSDLLGENVGKSVGYKIQLDKKISSETRLEIVTEGILVRQLQADPVLENYNLVVLDEFHERSVNTDLALAFLKEAMELRDDLFVIIMSATIDTDKLHKYLGEETPVMKIPGRQFPVEVIYDDKSSVESAIERELNFKQADANKGNILVFLPGIREIRRVESELKANTGVLGQHTAGGSLHTAGVGQPSTLERQPTAGTGDVELCILHSSISLEEQKRILRPSENRRVILSSAIAETSLTVPGVTTVIDSGLARVNRMNVGAGMEGLSTEIESEFSAEQRKGRAGRLMAGRCIRLWSEANPRIKNMPCEILRADLTTLVLECAERGVYSPEKIDWLDCPSSGAWESCKWLLNKLEMVATDGRITEKGKAALRLGVHPRLAGIALQDFESGKQLILKYSSFSKASPEMQKKFLGDLGRRVGGAAAEGGGETLILSGYPDRLAKCLSQPGAPRQEYKLASGRIAILADGKHGSEWIVAPDIMLGQNDAVIFDFENLNTQEVENWLENRTEVEEICTFENGKINKTENICYGKIVLSSKKVPSAPGDLAAAWVNEVKTKGLEALPLNNDAKSLLIRGQFLHGQELVSKCEKMVDEWLPPFLGTSKSLTEEIVYQGLYWFLKGEEINRDAPLGISLPNGNKAKVKYEKLPSPDDKNVLIIRPVIEIIIQRIFGCTETPEVGGVKVLLRLLSPASRPLQVTDDLEGFWTGAWPEICKEMKGRYPKHNWDF